MAIKQRKAPAPKPVREPEPESSSESEEEVEEFHSDPEDADEEPAAEYHTDHEDEEPAEYHTDPEDASDDGAEQDNDAALLPAELLKAKPAESLGTTIDWEKMTQKEKKALRDEMGLSTRELRNEAQRNGVIDAGRMAQLKRGIRPAEKVAGGRVAKRKRRQNRPAKVDKSGKQQKIEQKSREARKSERAIKKRKG